MLEIWYDSANMSRLVLKLHKMIYNFIIWQYAYSHKIGSTCLLTTTTKLFLVLLWQASSKKRKGFLQCLDYNSTSVSRLSCSYLVARKLNYTVCTVVVVVVLLCQERRVREMPEELSSIKIDLDLISSFPPQFCATTSVHYRYVSLLLYQY